MILCYHCNTCNNDFFLFTCLFVLVLLFEHTRINGTIIYTCSVFNDKSPVYIINTYIILKMNIQDINIYIRHD